MTSPRSDDRHPSLDTLLFALQDAGLRVGFTEHERLRVVLARHGEIDQDRLRLVVASVVVKSFKDQATFKRAFDAWLKESDERLDARAPQAPDEIARRSEPPLGAPQPSIWARTRQRLNERRAELGASWRGWAGVLAAVIALAALLYYYRGSTDPPHPGEPSAVTSSAAPTGSPATKPPPGSAAAPDPAPPAQDADPLRQAMGLAAGLAALAATIALVIHMRHRRWLPERRLPPAARGPFPLILRSPAAPGARLLDPRGESALLAGIGRFVSDESTRDLDVEATVDATAAVAGFFPVLRYQKARRSRKVHLWVDESASEPLLARLAGEIEAVLDRAQLPVERATFWGIPSRLRLANGTELSPDDLAEEREDALVVILTDGRLLTLHSATTTLGPAIQRLLRALTDWPRLAFAELSDRHGLRALLAPHRLTAVSAGDACVFLSGVPRAALSPPPPDPELAGEERIWMAACALSPEPVDEETAFALRAHLGLRASPWAIGLTGERDDRQAGWISWSQDERASLLNWLRDLEIAEHGVVSPDSVFGRALAFWERFYEEQDRQRLAENDGEGWVDTLARRKLQVLWALVTLWNRPAEATKRLYRLAAGGLESTIQRQLGRMTSGDTNGTPGLIVLPWRIEDQPPEVSLMLQDLGLAGAAPAGARPSPQRLRPSAWHGVALGLTGGVALGAAMAVGTTPGKEETNVDAGVKEDVRDLEADAPDAKPDAPDAKPDVADAKPDVADAKPGVADAKPGVADAKPGVADAEPDVTNAPKTVTPVPTKPQLPGTQPPRPAAIDPPPATAGPRPARLPPHAERCESGCIYRCAEGYKDVDGDLERGLEGNGCECPEKLAVELFEDADGDGSSSAKGQLCLSDKASATQAVRAANSGDCDDLAPDVHPGQTRFFDSPRANGTYDYDCNGRDERETTSTVACTLAGRKGEFYLDWLPASCQSPGEGWFQAAPSCGARGSWLLGCRYNAAEDTCEPVLTQRLQRCH